MTYTILLQAASGGSQQITSILMFVGMGIILYFFMYRPQSQKRKKQEKFVTELKKGRNVVTIGGIHGKIAETSAHTVTLELDRGMKVKFDKASISYEQTEAVENPAEKK